VPSGGGRRALTGTSGAVGWSTPAVPPDGGAPEAVA
jgi:hypothetical protein